LLQKNCTAQEYEEHASLLDRMTIVSPNHVEALSLAGHIPSPFTSDSELLRLFPNENDYWAILQRTGKLLLKGMKINSHQDGWERGVIIRVGALGCLVLTSSSITRIPAYFGEDDQDKVKDVTGGGNAFLGGVVAGMQLTDGRSLVEGKFT
jgi:sugar/nucleoside kinase (ribokinase family)